MADEPSLGEVNRNVTALRTELQAMRGELVRTDVYLANRLADDVRIKATETLLSDNTATLRAELRTIQENSTAMRRLVIGALVSAGFAIAGQIVVALILTSIVNR